MRRCQGQSANSFGDEQIALWSSITAVNAAYVAGSVTTAPGYSQGWNLIPFGSPIALNGGQEYLAVKGISSQGGATKNYTVNDQFFSNGLPGFGTNGFTDGPALVYSSASAGSPGRRTPSPTATASRPSSPARTIRSPRRHRAFRQRHLPRRLVRHGRADFLQPHRHVLPHAPELMSGVGPPVYPLEGPASAHFPLPPRGTCRSVTASARPPAWARLSALCAAPSPPSAGLCLLAVAPKDARASTRSSLRSRRPSTRRRPVPARGSS